MSTTFYNRRWLLNVSVQLMAFVSKVRLIELCTSRITSESHRSEFVY